MPPVAAAGAAVGAWVVGAAGGTAAAVSAGAAVGSAVAVGVVSGAVIGAATAAATGGDIFQGAVKGAVIGGVSAGVVSGLGMATGLASSEAQLASQGLSVSPAGEVAPLSVAPSEGILASGATSVDQTIPNQTMVPAGAPASTGSVADMSYVAPAKKAMSPETTKILSGVGEGIAKGVGEVGAAKMEAESAKELAEWEQQQDQLNIQRNIPGEFQARTASITIPDWWGTSLAPGVSTPGILAKG